MWLCWGRDARSTWILTNIQQVVNSDVIIVHNFHHNIYSSYLLLITIIYNNNTHTDNSRSLRSHVHPVERSPVERLLAADLRAPPTSNFLHKKLSQLQQVSFFNLSDVTKYAVKINLLLKVEEGKNVAEAPTQPSLQKTHRSGLATHLILHTCFASCQNILEKASNRKL